MSIPKRDLLKARLTADGLDDVFSQPLLGSTTVAHTGTSKVQATTIIGNTDDGRNSEGLPVEEAARLLNLSIKTIKDRLRKGTLKGFKVQDKFGERWLVEGLPAATQVSPRWDYQVVPSMPEPLPGTTEQFEKLLEVIARKDKELQAATYRNGYLEAQLQTKEEQLKLLPDLHAQATKASELEHQLKAEAERLEELECELNKFRQSWSARLCSWLFKK